MSRTVTMLAFLVCFFLAGFVEEAPALRSARTLIASGDTEGARLLLSTIEPTSKDFVTAMVLLAKCDIQTGERASAIRRLRVARATGKADEALLSQINRQLAELDQSEAIIGTAISELRKQADAIGDTDPLASDTVRTAVASLELVLNVRSRSEPAPVFLADLEHYDPILADRLAKKGASYDANTGKDGKVYIEGSYEPNSIVLVPRARSFSSVTYEIPAGYGVFRSRVALADPRPGTTYSSQSPVTWEVLLDGKSVWISRPVSDPELIQECVVALKDASRLTIRCYASDLSGSAYSVWIDPRFSVEAADVLNPKTQSPPSISDQFQPSGIFIPEPDGVGANARRIVYICDGSGSIGSSATRKAVLTSELKKAVDNLKSTQSFNVIFFADGTPAVLFDQGPRAATESNKRSLSAYINQRVMQGQTDPVPAIEYAFQQNPDLIFLLTDGEFFGSSTPEDVIGVVRSLNRGRRVPINTIMLDNDREEEHKTLRQIAEMTGGEFKSVDADKLLR